MGWTEGYYARNRERLLAAGRAWKRANPDRIKQQNIRYRAKKGRKLTYRVRKYGLSLEDYDALLLAQGNVCALCNEPFGKKGSERPVLDHEHDSLKIRGFIHDRCNVALGRFRDDPIKCRLAAKYLELHKSTSDNPAQPK